MDANSCKYGNMLAIILKRPQDMRSARILEPPGYLNSFDGYVILRSQYKVFYEVDELPVLAMKDVEDQ